MCKEERSFCFIKSPKKILTFSLQSFTVQVGEVVTSQAGAYSCTKNVQKKFSSVS